MRERTWRLPGHSLAGMLAKLTGGARETAPLDPEALVSGLEAPVQLGFDAHGVVHVQAQSAQDAFLAQGFLHGRDRGFQMDLARRFAEGSLAELLGEGALAYDLFLRQLDFRRHASSSLAVLSDEHRQWLQAYVQGVNQAWQGQPLSPEYRLLKSRPRPWTEIDTLGVSYQLAWTLNTVWQTKWAVEHLKDEPAALELLFGLGELHETIIPHTGPAGSLGATSVGSNNWVVSGAHTKSNSPLLANDPHLAPQLPSIWYEMWLEGGAFSVAGVTLPGAPGVIIGQNQSIAWGLTNVNPDVQDLYRIKMEEDGQTYLLDGQPTTLSRRDELIRIRGRADQVLTCWDSIWGPVIHQDGDSKVALAWTAFQPLPVLSSVLRLNLADDWASFQAAMADWLVPAQNVVYADRAGHIGYLMAGQLVTRPAAWAAGVQDGNRRAASWTGTVPMADTPRLFDPPSGVIVTANNPVVGKDHPVQVPGSFAAGARASRIRSLLTQSEQHDQESFGAIQMDVYSTSLHQFATRLADHPQLPSGWQESLMHFDGHLRVESVAPTICYLVAAEAVPDGLRRTLLQPFFSDVPPGLPDAHPFPERWWSLAGERMVPWLVEHWAELDLTGAVARADRLGRETFGSDLARWQWGRSHQAHPFHPLAEVALTRPLFGRRPLPMPGDSTTVLQAAISLDPTLPWPRRVLVMPSYRQVLDLGDRASSTAIHLTGQSGHCLSPHYDDLLSPYLAGQRFALGPGMAAARQVVLIPRGEHSQS